jgi:hypothetical protein
MPTEITAAILGALVGAFITYRFALALVTRQHEMSKELADREARRAAVARFRAAFAPTQAFVYIAQKHGTHDRPDLDRHLKDSLFSQGSAVEEFRPYIPADARARYQQAWEEYRAAAAADILTRTGEEWGSGLEEDQLVEKRVTELLRCAEI